MLINATLASLAKLKCVFNATLHVVSAMEVRILNAFHVNKDIILVIILASHAIIIAQYASDQIQVIAFIVLLVKYKYFYLIN